MAFLSKFGNILRQTTSMQINNAQLSASTPGLFQAFRSMSNIPSSKVFVGGISFQTDDQSLGEAFSKYGQVVEARVIMDRETGRSRGFGFVTYTSTEEASSAVQALDGQVLDGRNVKVDFAAERPPRNFGGGGYGGGDGGYGGGGGSYGGGGRGYGGSDGFSSGNYGGNVGGQGSYGRNFDQSGGANNYDGGNFDAADGGSGGGRDGYAAGGGA